MKIKITTERVLMIATLVVSIIGVWLFYDRRKNKKRDDDDDDNGKKGKGKGQKTYPLPYSAYPYEEFEDFSEDVCDRVFQGKCKKECKKGATQTCLDCMVVCEKQSLRV